MTDKEKIRAKIGTQGRLAELVKKYKTLKEQMYSIGGDIDKEARVLLTELQTIDGWDCMIKNCEAQYKQYPDKFFGWCSVTHTDNEVQFIKECSYLIEYEVLVINLEKNLYKQVEERKKEIELAQKKEQERIREKEMSDLKRLKEKYE